MLIYASTNLLVALSVDRWEAVVKPLAFTKNRSRGYHLVATSWLLAVVFAAPVTFVTKIKDIDGLPQCWIDLNNFGWRLYLIYLTSLLLIVPTLIIAVCYIQIVYTIWSKGRLVSDQQLKRDQQNHKQHTLQRGQRCISPESVQLDFNSSTKLNGGSWAKSRELRASSRLDRTLERLWSYLANSCHTTSGTSQLSTLKNVSDDELEVATTNDNKRPALNHNDREFERSCTVEVGPNAISRMSSRGNNESIRLHCNLGNDRVSSILGAGLGLGDATVRFSGQTSKKLEVNSQLENIGNELQSPAIARVQTETNLDDQQQHAHAKCQLGGVTIDDQHEVATDAIRSSCSQSSSNSPIALSSRSSVSTLQAAGQLSCALATTCTKAKMSKSNDAYEDLQQADRDDNNQKGERDDERRTEAPDLRDQRPLVGAAQEAFGGRIGDGKAEPRLPSRGHSMDSRGQGDSCSFTSTSRQPTMSPKRNQRRLSEDLGRGRQNVNGGAQKTAYTTSTLRIRAGDIVMIAGNSARGQENDELESSLDLLGSISRSCHKMGVLDGGDMYQHPNKDSNNKSNQHLKQLQRGGTQKLTSQAVRELNLTRRGDEVKATKQKPQQPIPGGVNCGRDQDFVACQQHGSGVIPKARIKTIKMTLVIVVAYILCWSPFLILNLCGVFGLIKNDTNVSHALLTLSQSLAHLNSAVNPIIFWLFSSRRSQTSANATTGAGGGTTTNHNNQHPSQANKTSGSCSNGARQHHFDRAANQHRGLVANLSRTSPPPLLPVSPTDYGEEEDEDEGDQRRQLK